jgi:DNA-binding CsgD family transcriptional regulator
MGNAMAQLNAKVAYVATEETLPATNRNQTPSQTLSDFEAEILLLIAVGKPTAEIATQVGTDQASVKDHIKSILRKAKSSCRPVSRPDATDLSASEMLSPFAA